MREDWTDLLIPTPARCRRRPGAWIPTPGWRLRAEPGAGAREIRELADACAAGLGQRPAPGAPLPGSGRHRILLDDLPDPASGASSLPETPEGYAIEVTPRGVRLEGRDAAGLAHAVRTFRQLLRFRPAGGAAVPCVRIADAPALPWRGVMADVGRQVERPDYLERLIDELAGYKLNLFMLYFEDKFRWRCRPELAHPFGYTAADFRRLARAAADRHVEFVPALASLGHCEGLLRHPSLARLREEGSVYQLSLRHPGTRRLLRDLYRELLPLYPGRFFHVNCDESPLLAGPPGSPPAYLRDSLRRFRDHLLFLRDLLAGHGKQALVWGDMLLHYPDLAAELPRDLVVVDWDYGSMRRRRRDAPARFRAQGFEVWVAPAAGRSAEVGLPPYLQIADNVPRYIRAGAEAGASGALVTMWEMFTTNPLVLRAGLAAGAQCAWAPRALPPDAVAPRIAAHRYGPRAAPDVVAAWKRLSGAGFARRYARAHGGPEVPGYRTYHPDSHEIVPTDPLLYATYAPQPWAQAIARDAAAGRRHLAAARAQAIAHHGELEAWETGARLQQYQALLRLAPAAASRAVAAAERARRAGRPGRAAERLAAARAALEDLRDHAAGLARRVAATWNLTRHPRDPALQDIHLRRLRWARRALDLHIAALRRAERRRAGGRHVPLGNLLGGRPVLFFDACNPSDTLVDVWQQRIEGSDDGRTWRTLMTKGWFLRTSEHFAMLQAPVGGRLPRRIRCTTGRLHIGPRQAPLASRLDIRVARTLTPAEAIAGAPAPDFETCDVRVRFDSRVRYRRVRAAGLVLEFERVDR